MGLKTFVKVGNITNLSDARYCAGMGVDQLGFNIDKSDSSYIDSETLESIKSWISGVEYVAEGGLPDNEDNFDAIQVPLSEYKSTKSKVILEIDIKDLENLPTGNNISYYILSGDSDKLSPEEVEEIKKYSNSFRIILGYGFDKENVLQILDSTGIKGLAMNGSEEIRPGYKDYDELADILELLEDDPWD